MAASDPISSCVGRSHEAARDEDGPGPASPSLHLLDLPTELLIEALHDMPRAARAACRTFRSLLDGGQKALSLRSRPSRSARRLHHLTALLHRLPSLTSLSVQGLEFKSLTFLTACPALECLAFADASLCPYSAPTLASLAACQRLRALDLSGCPELRSLEALPSLTALQSLDLRRCSQLYSVAPLEHCPSITSLTLGRSVHSLAPLSALTALASLVCHNGFFTNLVGLATCATSLTLLHLLGSPIVDFSLLSGHSRLTSLVMHGAYALNTLEPLALFGGALTHLSLEKCAVADIVPIASCTSLTSLRLVALDDVTDIRPLSSCTALVTLIICEFQGLTSLAPLSTLGRSLTHLDVSDCRVTDMSPLAPYTALQHLNLSDTGVTSVVPLVTCTPADPVGGTLPHPGSAAAMAPAAHPTAPGELSAPVLSTL